MAPAKFAAGWYFGITGKNRRKDIRKCYVVDDNLTDLLFDAMDSYIEGNMETGDVKMHQTKPLFQQSLSGCGQLADDMEYIAEWFANKQHEENWE